MRTPSQDRSRRTDLESLTSPPSVPSMSPPLCPSKVRQVFPTFYHLSPLIHTIGSLQLRWKKLYCLYILLGANTCLKTTKFIPLANRPPPHPTRLRITPSSLREKPNTEEYPVSYFQILHSTWLTSPGGGWAGGDFTECSITHSC